MPQDPAVIQQQIDDTRAELATTIDAIADIVSPKRVAHRAREQVKARVEEVRHRIRPGGDHHRSIGAGASDGQPALTTGEPVGAHLRRAVRWNRVGLAAGLLALLVVGAVRRHNSSD